MNYDLELMVNKSIRAELLQMMKEDQELIKSRSFDRTQNNNHIIRLKQIIETYGWPGYTLVGKDGAHAAWLIVQHADQNIPFQKKCLKILDSAVKLNQADSGDLAYLTDRVLVNCGRKQIYGTQFHIDKKGKYSPQPIENPETLDERRKEVGLESFQEYEKALREKVTGHLQPPNI